MIASPLLLVFAASLGATERYSIAPRPGWVEPLLVPGATSEGALKTGPVADHSRLPPETPPGGGNYELVDDFQVRVAGAGTERYFRRAVQIRSEGGVEEVSELKLEFNPSFERLTLHSIGLYRGGRRIDALKAADVKLLEQEDDLDRRLYDGGLSALVILSDVRKGDVLDCEWSIDGANPILKGKFVADLDLGGDRPIRLLRRRLLLPAARTFRHQVRNLSLEPEVAVEGGVRTYTWLRHDVAALADEDELPSWYDPYPALQVSEFTSWAEVAAWARDLFAAAGTASAEVEALADGLKRESAGDAARLVAAVRFVQDDVRYFGIEIGPSSHRPHPPAQVLAQRFGDCKDKAVLLVALLKRLAIAADPAFVDSSTGRSLDDWLPTPFAFDHTIVGVALGSEKLWIDATESLQGGGIARFRSSPFARALLLRPDTTALVALPAPDLPEPATEVEEHYRVEADGAARLEVRTTYRGEAADAMRASFAETTPADLGRAYLNHYAHDDPGIRAASLPQVDDDRPGDRVVVGESYTLPEFWNEDERNLYAWAIEDELQAPRIALRSMPLRVPHPVHLRHRISVSFPGVPAIRPEDVRIRHPAFELEVRSLVEGRTLTHTWRYRSLGDAVSPVDCGSYLRAIGRARDALNHVIARDDVISTGGLERAQPAAARRPALGGGGRGGRGERGTALAGPVALVLLLGWLLVIRLRARRRVAWERRTGFAPGEAPSEALTARSGEDIAGTLRRRPCRCGAAIADAEGQRRAVLYDRRRMTVITRCCASCGAEQTLYFDLRPPESAPA